MKAWGVAAVAVGIAACSAEMDEPGRRAAAPGAVYATYVPAAIADDSAVPAAVTWDQALQRPRQITGWFAVRPGQTVEAAAREVLARHAALFGVRADGRDLTVAWTRQGLAGTYVRFQQLAGDLPVLDRGVTVVVADDASGVRGIAFDYVHGLDTAAAAAPTGGDIGEAAALAAARAQVGSPPEELAPRIEHGILAPHEGRPARAAMRRVPRAVYRVTLAAPRATWQVTLAAGDGALVAVRDLNRHADGTGMVFDMNAVASTGNTALPDSNDQDSTALAAARFSVTLPRLDSSGFLRGPYADVKNPATRASEPTLAYDYQRADDRFEEVMVYYHLDRAQAHIQALGFTGTRGVNDRVQVATVNDGNQDNSFYRPSDKSLTFGAGGVDDAEDADIILHEYGHSIQDNVVPGFGDGEEADAMGEGFGDYLAAAFSTVLPAAAGHNQPALAACVGDWDAVSYDQGNPPCLRRVDGTEHFPEDASGQQHDDGEIWSGALWRARATVPPATMDTLVLEHHFLLGPAATFDQSANAILMADTMLNGGANQPALREALYRNGMLRSLRGEAGYPTATPETVDITNPTSGGVYANNLDDIQTVSRPGAAALRLHFATIATELHTGCLGGVCDNIYLYDAAGDLYEILGGMQTDVVSVQVPGDTIQIRLVTDGSVQGAGYVVDRVDVMSGVQEVDAAVDASPNAIDAAGGDGGGVIDAPMSGPDAGGGDPEDDDGGCCGAGGGAGAPGSLGLALVTLLAVRTRRRVRPAAAR